MRGKASPKGIDIEKDSPWHDDDIPLGMTMRAMNIGYGLV
jgi:hypothetical protein